MIEMKEMEKYADSRGLKMFIQFNIPQCRYDIIFEKFGFMTECHIPDNVIFDDEDCISFIRRTIDEADKCLNECKTSQELQGL